MPYKTVSSSHIWALKLTTLELTQLYVKTHQIVGWTIPLKQSP
jgi:hypothetical protein